MVDTGLSQAIKNLNPVEFTLNDRKIKLTITNHSFSCPEVPFGTIGVKNVQIYPTECRQRASTYKGKFFIEVDWYIDGVHQHSFQKDMGDVPIMIKVCLDNNYFLLNEK